MTSAGRNYGPWHRGAEKAATISNHTAATEKSQPTPSPHQPREPPAHPALRPAPLHPPHRLRTPQVRAEASGCSRIPCLGCRVWAWRGQEDAGAADQVFMPAFPSSVPPLRPALACARHVGAGLGEQTLRERITEPGLCLFQERGQVGLEGGTQALASRPVWYPLSHGGQARQGGGRRGLSPPTAHLSVRKAGFSQRRSAGPRPASELLAGPAPHRQAGR